MTTTRQYPFYFKSTVILFGLVLMAYIMVSLREELVPLAFGLLLAILLNPLATWFERRMSRPLSITVALILAIIVLGAIGYFLISQISGFTDELPALQQKMHSLTDQGKMYAHDEFGISVDKENQLLHDIEAKVKPFIGRAVGSLLGVLGMLILIPVYTFLFLLYKTRLTNFLFDVFEKDNSKELTLVLDQTKGAIQNYMLGLLIEMLVIATLNTIVLLILGVKYAFLLGILGALLNILPYIGGIISIVLTVILITITKDGFHTQVIVIIAHSVIQFVDKHFLIPYIVSSRVKINALVSIAIVFMGGALWGAPGMFLSIPFIGVLKIIFDRVPELQPWGKLLGDEVPAKRGAARAKTRVSTKAVSKSHPEK